MARPTKDIKPVPHCKICKHEEVEAIEMVGLLSCSSWSIARDRINSTFGTNFTTETVRKHMTEHPLHKTAMEQGVILDAIRGKDGSTGIISVETMLQTLFVQGMLDLAQGKIRCKTPADLIAVMNTLMNVQAQKEAKFAIENGDASAFYNVMAAYGAAINDTVSPAQMREIVAKANALGANFNIGNTQIVDTIDVEPVDYMQQAVDDFNKMGRTRTRDELIEAGVIAQIDNLGL